MKFSLDFCLGSMPYIRVRWTGASILDRTEEEDMPLGTFATENLRVCPQNGDAPIQTKGRDAGTITLINDVRVPLRVGDAVERSLPSGIIDAFHHYGPGLSRRHRTRDT